MVSVIYLHGTGVRKEKFDVAFNLVKQNLEHIPGTEHIECFWGEKHGVQMDNNWASVPVPDTVKSLSGDITNEEDKLVELWDWLYIDPSLELEAIEQIQPNATKAVNFSAKPLHLEVRESFQNKDFSDEFIKYLKKLGLEHIFNSSYASTVNSGTFEKAVERNPEYLKRECEILARSTVATILKKCDENSLSHRIVYDSEVRDRLVQKLTTELGGSPKGIKKFIMNILTNIGIKKRKKILNKLYRQPGDILLYMARGEQITNFIRKRIENAKYPIILLGHSLGGIVSVDLLASGTISNVSLLVTMGSQAPFLYELNALKSLSPPEPLPANFPPWINFYNHRDFLSFIGGPIFSKNKVQDVELKISQPFPKSHDALSYLSNKKMWEKLHPFLSNNHE